MPTEIQLEQLKTQCGFVVDALLSGRVVPFLGAGVNLCDRPKGAPRWQKPGEEVGLPSGREHVVDKIISAQKGEKRCVQTPYLQLVLERWWNREIDSSSHELREKTLQDLGGVETMVDRHLELTLSHLSPRRDRGGC